MLPPHDCWLSIVVVCHGPVDRGSAAGGTSRLGLVRPDLSFRPFPDFTDNFVVRCQPQGKNQVDFFGDFPD